MHFSNTPTFPCTCAILSKLIWAHQNNYLLGYLINLITGIKNNETQQFWHQLFMWSRARKDGQHALILQLHIPKSLLILINSNSNRVWSSHYTNRTVICPSIFFKRCISLPYQGKLLHIIVLNYTARKSVNTKMKKSWMHKSSRIHQPCLISHLNVSSAPDFYHITAHTTSTHRSVHRNMTTLYVYI